jgi:hypothetical protein
MIEINEVTNKTKQNKTEQKRIGRRRRNYIIISFFIKLQFWITLKKYNYYIIKTQIKQNRTKQNKTEQKRIE